MVPPHAQRLQGHEDRRDRRPQPPGVLRDPLSRESPDRLSHPAARCGLVPGAGAVGPGHDERHAKCYATTHQFSRTLTDLGPRRIRIPPPNPSLERRDRTILRHGLPVVTEQERTLSRCLPADRPTGSRGKARITATGGIEGLPADGSPRFSHRTRSARIVECLGVAALPAIEGVAGRNRGVAAPAPHDREWGRRCRMPGNEASRSRRPPRPGARRS
jgi:hypothetical protein